MPSRLKEVDDERHRKRFHRRLRAAPARGARAARRSAEPRRPARSPPVAAAVALCARPRRRGPGGGRDGGVDRGLAADREDPHKAAIVSKLRHGGHVGPLVATSGRWSLYADGRGHGPTDAELSSGNETVASGFLGRKPIELTAVGDDCRVTRLLPARSTRGVLLPWRCCCPTGGRSPCSSRESSFWFPRRPAHGTPRRCSRWTPRAGSSRAPARSAGSRLRPCH